MKILLTNDDGVYAPGLAALERSLQRLGQVYVVAPSKEQSGVSHSITFLTPLMVKNVFVDEKQWGWAVDGSPADCVKLGISEILPEVPDLVVSGINGGLNAGINILYSGTVAAAVEGAFYGVPSIAVSLEYDENEPFHRAAELATSVIEHLLARQKRTAKLFNLNIPLKALKDENPTVCVSSMDVTQYWESFERRTDPLGRSYYWMTGRPNPRNMNSMEQENITDLKALSQGWISLTPLRFDMTYREELTDMQGWSLGPIKDPSDHHSGGPSIRTTVRR